MKDIDKIKIYEKIYKAFGRDAIIIKTIEELSELIKELCHCIEPSSKHKFDINNLKSEIADIEVVLNHIKLLFNINDYEIELIKNYKLNRIKCRLEK